MDNHFYWIEVTDSRSDPPGKSFAGRFVRTTEEIMPQIITLSRKYRVSLELLPSRPVVGETYDFGHVALTVRKCEFS